MKRAENPYDLKNDLIKIKNICRMHIDKNKISKTNSSIPKSGIFNQNQENEDSFSSQINFPITKKKQSKESSVMLTAT